MRPIAADECAALREWRNGVVRIEGAAAFERWPRFGSRDDVVEDGPGGGLLRELRPRVGAGMENPALELTIWRGRVERLEQFTHEPGGELGVGERSVAPARVEPKMVSELVEAAALGRVTAILVLCQQCAGARVHNMRELEAVQPYAGRGRHTEAPAGRVEDEKVVAETIVGDERHGVDELEKRRDAIGKRGRTLQIRCRDAGELLDLRQERALGSRERGELVHGPVDDPASADLDDLVIRRVGLVSVRLEVEHYVIAVGRDRRRNAIVAE